MTDAVARIRRIAALVADGGLLGDDGVWLSSVLSRTLDQAHTGETFEQACGLLPGWWRSEQRRRRDNASTMLSNILVPIGGIAEKSDAVRRELRRYRDGAWRRRDQYAAVSPCADPAMAAHWLFEWHHAQTMLMGDAAYSEKTGDSPAHLRRVLLSA